MLGAALPIALLLPLVLSSQGTGQKTSASSVEKQVATGVEALKVGDLVTAERVFSDAMRHGFTHPLIFHNLGIIAQQRGNHTLAVKRFRQAIQLQPDYGPSHLLMGVSLRALGKNVEAVAELRRAVRLMPNEPQVHLQLAKGYEDLEDWIAAVKELQQLVILAPEEPEYRYQLGRAWSQLSGWSYQQILHFDPKSARLQQALGQDYAIQGKYDLALAAYQRAARSDPALPEVHLAEAVILLELKRLDEALTQINLEQQLVPESQAAAEIKAQIEAARSTSSP